MTGFIGLGTIGLMGYSSGAAGDPTALSPELLTALGITTTRTGSLHSHLLATTPGQGFYVAAPNEPIFERGVIAGIPVRGLLVQGASNPLVTNSADLTNSAWTKTGSTAERGFSGLTGSRYNRLPFTEDFSNAAWAKSLCTVTADAVAAPDGEAVADRLTFTGTSAPQVSINGWANEAGTYILSAYAKFNTFPYVVMYASDAVAAYSAAWFDIEAGNLLSSASVGSGFSAQSAGIESVGSGWHRLWLKFTKTLTANSSLSPCHSSNGNASFTGVNGQIVELWGAQLEQASDLSAYEPVLDNGLGRFHSLVTGTAANWTVTRTITRSSAVRKTRWRIEAPETNVGDVLVGHGAPTGSELVTNGAFDSDLSGWTLSTGVSWSWSAGVAASSGSGLDRLSQSFTTVVGKRYRVNTTVGGIGEPGRWIGTSDGGSQIISANAPQGTTSVYFTATATTTWITFVVNSATPTVDNVSVREVAETTITPGSFQDIALDEYTGANPQLSIRGTNSGDTVRHYDVQHEESAAGIPAFKWHPAQGASNANVGSSLARKTFVTGPAEIRFSILFRLSSASFPRYVTFSDGTLDNTLELFNDGGNLFFRFRSGGAGLDVLIYSGSLGDLVLAQVEWTGSIVRARANGGSWNSSTYQAVPDFVTLDIASYFDGNRPFTSISAIRDDGQTFLADPYGWNIQALEAYEASL